MPAHEQMLADLEKQLGGLEEQINKLFKVYDPATVKPDIKNPGKLRRFLPNVPADDDVMNKAKKKDSDDNGEGADDDESEDDYDDMDDDEDNGANGKTEKAAPKAEPMDTDIKKADDDHSDDESLEVGGQVITKSQVGEAQFAIFKSQNEAIAKAHDELAKERDRREMVELKKRADDEFPELPGTLDERANMLRAIGKLDEPLRKAFEKVFKQSQSLASKAFESVGYAGGHETGPQVFEQKVSEIKKRDNCTRTEAMQKARAEFPSEYQQFQGNNGN
jgi:hypothetical protein